MGNVIALSKNYVPLLDQVYKKAALSSVLNTADNMVKEGNKANEILVPKISMQGLGDYSRNSGYTKGDVNLSWETVKFNYDRGRKFEVDYLDNEETAEIAFGMLGAEFQRTKVAPEADAFTFATLAGVDGISKATASTIADGSALLTALIAATTKMDEDEVPEENRILFITPTLHNAIMALDTTKSREVMSKFSQVIKVPQSRFYTAIELLDGSTAGELDGGYRKSTVVGSEGKDINFMIIHKPCVLKFDKHIANDIITPTANQSSDAYMQKYRKYGLVDAYENKVAGIYLHHKA